ncbi:hypothetical protein ACYOEI_36600 [Singulisphaera rosea]
MTQQLTPATRIERKSSLRIPMRMSGSVASHLRLAHETSLVSTTRADRPDDSHGLLVAETSWSD